MRLCVNIDIIIGGPVALTDRDWSQHVQTCSDMLGFRVGPHGYVANYYIVVMLYKCCTT